MGLKVKKGFIHSAKESYAHQAAHVLSQKKISVDCSLGINPYGFTNLVNEKKQCIQDDLLCKYPTVDKNFKKRIIHYWKDITELQNVNIHLGAGTMGVCELVNRIFIDDSSRVLGYCPQFTDYMYDVEKCGGEFDYIKLKFEKNFKLDGNEMISKLDKSYNLVYIDNPNNPTGQIIPMRTIESIVREAQKMDIPVLVDEAYGDFMKKDNSAISLVNEYDNLFVARSFSKGFGFAGLRVGYLVVSECLSKYYAKATIPFPINGVGQYFANIALQDEDFINSCRSKIAESKRKIRKACSKIKILQTDDSVPIMTLLHPDKNVDLYEEFINEGILTNSGTNFVNLEKNSVRLRVSKQIEPVLDAISSVEKRIDLRQKNRIEFVQWDDK